MNSQQIAYFRVSTIDQSLKRQHQLLNEVHIDKIFEEKVSAKNVKRPVFEECLSYCREGDTLHVFSIDRMARNLRDLQDIVKKMNIKGVTIRFHKESLIFTSDNDDAMSTLMLQMMGAFAEFERSLIRERQREGIAAAKAKGKKFGRKKALSSDQVAEIKKRVNKGEQKRGLAAKMGISRTTLYKALKEAA